jgi:hypothetical protein
LIVDPSIDQNFGARIETKEQAKPRVAKLLPESMLIGSDKRKTLAL